MGFFVAVDCVVAKVGGAAVGNASGVGDTIDSNSRRKLTAAHNETLNSRRVTSNNNGRGWNDVHRHCDVGYSSAVLHNIAHILMNSDVNNQDARVNDSPFVSCVVDALDIHRMAHYNGVEGLESSNEWESDLIQLNVEQISHNICLDHKRELANNFHNCFAASVLI